MGEPRKVSETEQSYRITLAALREELALVDLRRDEIKAAIRAIEGMPTEGGEDGG